MKTKSRPNGRILTIFMLILISVISITSCNIFSIFHKINFSSMNSLLSEGDSAYQNGDFQVAFEKYKAVMKEDDRSSRARVGYANCYAKLRFVDFLYIAQEIGKTNFDAFVLLNDHIVKNNVVGPNGVFQTTIDVLSPIATGQCDGDVPFDDFNVNIQLCTSYLLRGFIKLADSNEDGVIASSNDLMLINGSGINMNEQALNFDGIATSLSNAKTKSPDAGLGGGAGDPLSIFMSATNAASLTNLQTGTNNSFRYYIQSIHDSIETSLVLLKNAGGSISYIDLSFESINRIFNKYRDSVLLGDISKNVAATYLEVNRYSSMIGTYGNSFMSLHFNITGINRSTTVDYLTSSSFPLVRDYVSSPFWWHLNGQTPPAGMVAIALLPADNISTNNAQSLIYILSNSKATFQNADLTTQIMKWLGF